MNRPALIALALIATPAAAQPVTSLCQRTAAELQSMLRRGSTSSEAITRDCLARIAALDRTGPHLNAVITTNPDALAQARARDAARRAGRSGGPLDGIPVLIKDNIETADRMPTTAGSLALVANITRRDSPLVANLRAGGAVILGKTNLSEWANWRSTAAVSGWSGVGGLVKNPYALDRTACGSSSGSGAAVAAGLAPLAVGTETDGSVVCPSSVNGLVGIKPTLGLVSRTHVVPISGSQDTPGPMARSVTDAAAMLGVMAGSDPADAATADADKHKRDYAADLPTDLHGIRIGVLRDRVGTQTRLTVLFQAALARLAAAGATLVEIRDSHIDPGIAALEQKILLSEFKPAVAAYLAATPAAVQSRTLADLIAFDRAHATQEMPWFDQELFDQSQATKGLADPEYIHARDTAKRLAGPDGIDRLLRENNVSILVQPTQGAAWLSDPVNGDSPSGPSASDLPAVSGYPHVTVPMGQLRQLPVGLSFIGPRWSEAALIRAAHSYETARGPFPRPRFLLTAPR